MNRAKLADTLREIRADKGVSLRQTARQVEVDAAYLSRIERGDTRPSSEVLTRLSTYYDVSPDTLLLAAGHVPDDVVDILQRHPEAVDELRRRYGDAS